MEFSFHRSAASRRYLRILLIMKLTAILLLAVMLHAGAKGVAQQVTLSVVNMPLDKVCKEIEKQTGYYFVYAKDMSEQPHLVSLTVTKVPVDEALRKVFAGLPFTYQVIDKVVVVNTVNHAVSVESPSTAAPAVEIKGKVINVQSEPLAGATVISSKTGLTTETDAGGHFGFKGLSFGDTLVISYTGYKTQYWRLMPGHASFTVVLELTDNELDKVVIQAYGTTSQRLTTGNIAVVTSADIEKQAVMNPLMAMEGKVAGLVITPQTGYESGPLKVELRGRNTINPFFATDPLYIIDGVPLTVLEVSQNTSAFPSSATGSYISKGFDQTNMSFAGGQSPLFSLNPADIESIEVLKDADATAIYGSRGANGVILINTKRGKPGLNHLDITVSQGESSVGGKQWAILNTPQFLAMRREAYKNDSLTPSATPGPTYAPDLYVWDTTRYTNWQKYFFGGMGRWTNVQGALSGGSAQTTFRLGAGYNHETDITTVSGANQRASLSFNLANHSVNNRFKMMFATNYSYAQVNMISSSIDAILPPDAPAVYAANGSLNYAQWDASKSTIGFPFANLLMPYESKTSFLTSSLALSYTLMKGLEVRTSLGYNNTQVNQTSFTPIAALDPYSATKPTGSATFGSDRVNNLIAEPQAEYNGIISRGKINALIGGTVQSTNTDGMEVLGLGYTDDALLHSISNAPTVKSFDNYAEYKYAGVFARLGYNWADKYLLNLNARRDGSSRFGSGKQFGNFGSVGAAWILSEEKWAAHLLPSVISFIKLRSSYGITGGDAIGDYKYLSQWGNSSSSPVAAYAGVSGIVPEIQPNPNFHWQVNRKLEGAVDISLFKDKINLEAAYYQNRCNNQLVAFPTPEFTGFSSVAANSPADVENSGWEFLANARVMNAKGFSWTVNFNIGINRNRLLAYPDIAQSPYYTRYKIGESLDNYYVFHYTGVNPQTGQYTYTDYHNTGKIIENDQVPPGTGDDDRGAAVNMAPKFTGGLGNQFGYKNWALSAYFTFSRQMGQNALSAAPGGVFNTSVYQFDNRWQKPGDIRPVARFTTTPQLSDFDFIESTGNFTDASYIRLQTLELAYSLSAKLAHKAGMTKLSVKIDAQNVFVLTRYKGVDPETQNFGGLPLARTVTAGLSCSF